MMARATCAGASSGRKWPLVGSTEVWTSSATNATIWPTRAPNPFYPPIAHTGVLILDLSSGSVWAMLVKAAR